MPPRTSTDAAIIVRPRRVRARRRPKASAPPKARPNRAVDIDNRQVRRNDQQRGTASGLSRADGKVERKVVVNTGTAAKPKLERRVKVFNSDAESRAQLARTNRAKAAKRDGGIRDSGVKNNKSPGKVRQEVRKSQREQKKRDDAEIKAVGEARSQGKRHAAAELLTARRAAPRTMEEAERAGEGKTFAKVITDIKRRGETPTQEYRDSLHSAAKKKADVARAKDDVKDRGWVENAKRGTIDMLTNVPRIPGEAKRLYDDVRDTAIYEGVKVIDKVKGKDTAPEYKKANTAIEDTVRQTRASAPGQAAGAAALLAVGDRKGAKREIKDAGRAFKQDPVGSALAVGGVTGAALRAGGRGARQAKATRRVAKRKPNQVINQDGTRAKVSRRSMKQVREQIAAEKRILRAGAQKRAPLQVRSAKRVVATKRRTYSENPAVKAAQKINDARRSRGGRDATRVTGRKAKRIYRKDSRHRGAVAQSAARAAQEQVAGRVTDASRQGPQRGRTGRERRQERRVEREDTVAFNEGYRELVSPATRKKRIETLRRKRPNSALLKALEKIDAKPELVDSPKFKESVLNAQAIDREQAARAEELLGLDSTRAANRTKLQAAVDAGDVEYREAGNVRTVKGDARTHKGPMPPRSRMVKATVAPRVAAAQKKATGEARGDARRIAQDEAERPIRSKVAEKRAKEDAKPWVDRPEPEIPAVDTKAAKIARAAERMGKPNPIAQGRGEKPAPAKSMIDEGDVDDFIEQVQLEPLGVDDLRGDKSTAKLIRRRKDEQVIGDLAKSMGVTTGQARKGIATRKAAIAAERDAITKRAEAPVVRSTNPEKVRVLSDTENAQLHRAATNAEKALAAHERRLRGVQRAREQHLEVLAGKRKGDVVASRAWLKENKDELLKRQRKVENAREVLDMATDAVKGKQERLGRYGRKDKKFHEAAMKDARTAVANAEGRLRSRHAGEPGSAAHAKREIELQDARKQLADAEAAWKDADARDSGRGGEVKVRPQFTERGPQRPFTQREEARLKKLADEDKRLDDAATVIAGGRVTPGRIRAPKTATTRTVRRRQGHVQHTAGESGFYDKSGRKVTADDLPDTPAGYWRLGQNGEGNDKLNEKSVSDSIYTGQEAFVMPDRSVADAQVEYEGRLGAARIRRAMLANAVKIGDEVPPADRRGKAMAMAEAATDRTGLKYDVHEVDGEHYVIPAEDLKTWHRMKAASDKKGLGKAVDWGNRKFVRAVLPFSPGWHAGNFVDLQVRIALMGGKPGDRALGEHVAQALRDVDTEWARHVVDSVGGAHFSAMDATFAKTKPLSEKGAKLVAPGTRMIDGLLAAGKRVEAGGMQQAQGLVSRKLMQELGLTDHVELARQMRDDPSLVEDFQRRTLEISGDYLHHPTIGGKDLRAIAPFAQWIKASFKFTMDTLPRKHPLRTAMLFQAAQMTEEQRRQTGMSAYITKEEAKALEVPEPRKGFLAGAVATPGGGAIPTSMFTSFGSVANYMSDPLAIGSQFVPWLNKPAGTGAANSMDSALESGLKKGHEAVGGPTTQYHTRGGAPAQRVADAARDAASGLVPGVNPTLRALREGKPPARHVAVKRKKEGELADDLQVNDTGKAAGALFLPTQEAQEFKKKVPPKGPELVGEDVVVEQPVNKNGKGRKQVFVVRPKGTVVIADSEKPTPWPRRKASARRRTLQP